MYLEKSRGRLGRDRGGKTQRGRDREKEGVLTALYRSVKCKLLFMGPTG